MIITSNFRKDSFFKRTSSWIIQTFSILFSKMHNRNSIFLNHSDLLYMHRLLLGRIKNCWIRIQFTNNRYLCQCLPRIHFGNWFRFSKCWCRDGFCFLDKYFQFTVFWIHDNERLYPDILEMDLLFCTLSIRIYWAFGEWVWRIRRRDIKIFRCW